MDFCEVCGFKYWVVTEEDELWNKCRNCGHRVKNERRVIEVRKLKDDIGEQVNPDIVDDPTYPRTTRVKCPNRECPSRKAGVTPMAVFYQSPLTLKVVNICVHCKTQWGSGGKAAADPKAAPEETAPEEAPPEEKRKTKPAKETRRKAKAKA